MSLDPIEEAIETIAAGKPVVVVDDEDRENEGDLVFAAETITPAQVALMMTECRGLICVPLLGDACDRLDLPPAYPDNQDRHGTAFTVAVDARDGTTTGISAADRAHTIRALADPDTTAFDLRRPGHVFPLRARPGGVLARRGHTEAATDLARLAGRRPAGAICEIANHDGTMARLPELRVWAKEHEFPLISIADLADYRWAHEVLVERVATTRLPTEHGSWTAVGYRCLVDAGEHLALVYGELGDGEDVLVRVHSECLTGDVLGSRRCDCGPQLNQAMAAVAATGRGVVLYVRGHEGRGIGLLPKLMAYAHQDAGADTVDANLELGLPADARSWAVAGQILRHLGIRSMRAITRNPVKLDGLERFGPAVLEQVRLPVHVTADNLRYLRTKRDRMGHDLPDLAPGGEA